MGIRIISDADGYASLQFGDVDDSVRGGITYNSADDSLQLRGYNNTTRATIDSLGNLLVGTTSTDPNSTAGAQLAANGRLLATVDGSNAGYFNRLTSDGELVRFEKDGSTVGSIGATSGVLTIGNNNSGGIIFGYNGSHTFIEPSNTSGASVDDGATLGSSSKRFRDLYLSGNAYVGNAVTSSTDGSSDLKLEGNQHIFRKGVAGSYTERMRIDSSGRLLLGQTSNDDGAAVQIDANSSGSTVYSLRLENSNTATDVYNAIRLIQGASGSAVGVMATGGSTTGNPSYRNVFHVGTQNATSLVLGTNDTERMRIDSSGSVGIGTGTNTPKGVLDVQGGVYSNLTLSSAHGYSQNRNWDFISNSFGSGSWGGLSLRQSTDTGGTPSVSRFGIDINGKVGFGQTSPAARVHITEAANKSETDSHLRIEGAGYSGFHWLNGTAYYIGQNSNGRQLRMYSGSNEGVGVYLTNGGNSWSSYSDERLKENIQDIGSVTEKIKDIRCVTYNRKDVDDENKHETIGFIAQDFIGKFDQVLDESKVLDADEETRYSIRYTETIPILMKAIQEQQELINNLTSRIEELEN
jgi:hypothetical protein